MDVFGLEQPADHHRFRESARNMHDDDAFLRVGIGHWIEVGSILVQAGRKYYCAFLRLSSY